MLPPHVLQMGREEEQGATAVSRMASATLLTPAHPPGPILTALLCRGLCHLRDRTDGESMVLRTGRQHRASGTAQASALKAGLPNGTATAT